MKIYIPHCHSCNFKIPLIPVGLNRQHVRNVWGNQFNIQCPTCYAVHRYYPGNVFAETDSNAKIGGGVVGGLLGLLGGPLGFVIGAGIGTAIGNNSDTEDEQKVKRFNASH